MWILLFRQVAREQNHDLVFFHFCWHMTFVFVFQLASWGVFNPTSFSTLPTNFACKFLLFCEKMFCYFLSLICNAFICAIIQISVPQEAEIGLLVVLVIQNSSLRLFQSVIQDHRKFLFVVRPCHKFFFKTLTAIFLCWSTREMKDSHLWQ